MCVCVCVSVCVCRRIEESNWFRNVVLEKKNWGNFFGNLKNFTKSPQKIKACSDLTYSSLSPFQGSPELQQPSTHFPHHFELKGKVTYTVNN